MMEKPDISKIQELRVQRSGRVEWIYFAWIDGAWVDLAPFGNRMPEPR